MKIKIINPNTTWTMTEDISVAGKKFARPDTEVYAVSPSTGPESIESMYDEYLAVPGVLSEIIKGDREEHADAFIIACFGDPGLLAAKGSIYRSKNDCAQFFCRIRIGSFRTGSSGVTSPARRGAILQILPQHWSWRPRF